MNAPTRPLQGFAVSLSISESDDAAERGFPGWQVNRVTVQVATALFGQGAGVVFGHDWREDGVMEAVHGFALQMQPPIPLSPTEARSVGQPLLRNLLPWPDKPLLPQEALEMLNSTLVVESVGLPEELRSVEAKAKEAGPASPLYRYIRARGLTFLRHRLNEASQARLCLGGRQSGYAGRYPGVVEEALLALRSRKPLYLAGLLGGAAKQVVDAIVGREMPDEFSRPTSITSLYDRSSIKELDPATRDDRVIDRTAVWVAFKDAGLEGIANTNGLTSDENEELFHTPVLDRVIQLVLTGLSRLRAT